MLLEPYADYPLILAINIQIWDIIYTFSDRLGFEEVPSLSLLIEAFEVADRTRHRHPTAREKKLLVILQDIALRFTGK